MRETARVGELVRAGALEPVVLGRRVSIPALQRRVLQRSVVVCVTTARGLRGRCRGQLLENAYLGGALLLLRRA